jgi:predicted dehydrogenase
MNLERGTLSRRGFIQRSIGGMAAAGLPVWFAKNVVSAAELEQAQQNQPVQPNDRIVMGHIGCGNPMNGRGRDIARGAAGIAGVQYVACCDVDRTNRESFAQIPQINGGRKLALYSDFRELLARPDIQAVTIATVDHWHALVAIAAMKAGKDVYCEKPLTLAIAEGKAMVRVAKETNRRLQTGSQQRTEFAGRFLLAAELVRNGRLGRIQSIECRVGDNPIGGPFSQTPPPQGLDWDFWLGPTPHIDYVPEKCFYNFRWFYEYSGGKMTDWGAHHLDIAQWALNMDSSGPIEVEGTGEGVDPRPLCYNCHPRFTATYRYANGTTLRATDGLKEARNVNNGIHFVGEEGKWLFVSRNTITASDRRLLDEPLPNNAVRLGQGNSHMRNFLSCVRSRQQPIANVEVGHRSVTVCHLGTLAIRTGMKLRWNPETEQFVDNDRANQWLSRPMRAPWRLDA